MTSIFYIAQGQIAMALNACSNMVHSMTSLYDQIRRRWVILYKWLSGSWVRSNEVWPKKIYLYNMTPCVEKVLIILWPHFNHDCWKVWIFIPCSWNLTPKKCLIEKSCVQCHFHSLIFAWKYWIFKLLLMKVLYFLLKVLQEKCCKIDFATRQPYLQCVFLHE